MVELELEQFREGQRRLEEEEEKKKRCLTCTGWAPRLRLRAREGGRAWPDAWSRLRLLADRIITGGMRARNQFLGEFARSSALANLAISHLEPRDRFAKKIWHNRYEPRSRR